VDSLSRGMQQRVGIARALIHDPKVLLLDEPTSGLDPQSRRELHGVIRQMRADGRTVLLSTHYIEEAELLCDRIAIIDHGRVIATGAPRELIARSSAVQTVTLVTLPALARERVARVPGVHDVGGEGGTLRFRTDRPTETLAALAGLIAQERVELVELQVKKASLEDVFVGLTGRDEAVAAAGEAGT